MQINQLDQQKVSTVQKIQIGSPLSMNETSCWLYNFHFDGGKNSEFEYYNFSKTLFLVFRDAIELK